MTKWPVLVLAIAAALLLSVAAMAADVYMPMVMGQKPPTATFTRVVVLPTATFTRVVVPPTATSTRVIVPPTATSTRASVPPTPTATTQVAVCACSGDLYNCSSFSTHAQAQACFNYCWQQVGSDVHDLDGNDDGLACESLP